ncbi:MAG: hypothetical protein WC551_10190 [Patescibacteria group bacterium]
MFYRYYEHAYREKCTVVGVPYTIPGFLGGPMVRVHFHHSGGLIASVAVDDLSPIPFTEEERHTTTLSQTMSSDDPRWMDRGRRRVRIPITGKEEFRNELETVKPLPSRPIIIREPWYSSVSRWFRRMFIRSDV